MHRQRLVDRVRLRSNVERIDRQREGPSSSCAPVFSERIEHAVALVHQRRLLGNQVEPVEDRVHEQGVVLLVGGDRLVEVVLDLQIDRQSSPDR